MTTTTQVRADHSAIDTVISKAATNKLESQTLPPVTCAPWCQDGNGHTAEWHPDDQSCYSDYEQVPISTRALVRYTDGTRRLQTLDLLLRRHRCIDTVVISDEASNSEIDLTFTEAADMISALTALLQKAGTTP